MPMSFPEKSAAETTSVSVLRSAADPILVIDKKASFLKSEVVGINGDYVYVEDKLESVHYEIEVTLKSGAQSVIAMSIDSRHPKAPLEELARVYQDWVAYVVAPPKHETISSTSVIPLPQTPTGLKSISLP